MYYFIFTGKQVKYQEYVDQSRVISVCLGPPDIRTSMLKQRMFLNRSVFFMKEEQQGHKIFVEQAMHKMHRGAFDLAVYYLRRAIRVSKIFKSLFKNKSTMLEEMI